MNFLIGKKTYIVAAAAIVGALAGLATGTITPAEAIQTVVTAIIGATIRHGITTSGK